MNKLKFLSIVFLTATLSLVASAQDQCGTYEATFDNSFNPGAVKKLRFRFLGSGHGRTHVGTQTNIFCYAMVATEFSSGTKYVFRENSYLHSFSREGSTLGSEFVDHMKLTEPELADVPLPELRRDFFQGDIRIPDVPRRHHTQFLWVYSPTAGKIYPTKMDFFERTPSCCASSTSYIEMRKITSEPCFVDLADTCPIRAHSNTPVVVEYVEEGE